MLESNKHDNEEYKFYIYFLIHIKIKNIHSGQLIIIKYYFFWKYIFSQSNVIIKTHLGQIKRVKRVKLLVLFYLLIHFSFNIKLLQKTIIIWIIIYFKIIIILVIKPNIILLKPYNYHNTLINYIGCKIKNNNQKFV